ncbi:acyl-CoA dehydrogenase family protein [Candidatus Poriferisocius sp.]|uniref:acyl-CoA dehydrogenase family protein n=1 Tax=Candidatus Poriferisocius sp. TaxID=3101276 RepID=UPI003B58D872
MTLAPLLGSAIAPPALPEGEERALAVLDEVIAEVVAPLAPEHDEGGRYPTRAIAALKASGFLGLAVPAEFGGVGASHTASLSAQVRLAVADSSVAQVYKVHDELVREIFSYCSDDLKPRLASLVLEESAVLGLAVAEAGKTVADPFTTVAREQDDGGHVISGQKIYTTGSAEADYVAVWGINPERFTPENPFLALQLNLVAEGTPGMTIHRDWDALGQRATDSGSISFENVRVGPEWNASIPGRAPLPHSGVRFEAGFAAVNVGIGIGALAAAIPFVNEHSRPWPSAEVDNAAEDPMVQRTTGELVADLAAAHELTMRCGGLLDSFERGEISRTDLAIPVYAARSAADRAGLAAAQGIYGLMGTRSARRPLGFDQWWRNVRTLTLHDPVEWKHVEIGRHVLTGWDPPPGIYT